MSDPDVVFVTRNHVRRPELQYALRSLSMIPHGKVWVVGGCPAWIVNVNHVPFREYADKWRNISDKFKSLAHLDGLSEQFIYTEDDYFITKPVVRLPAYVHSQGLNERVAEYERKRKRSKLGGWQGYLQATRDALHQAGIADPVSYDVHIPMLAERSMIPLDWDTGRPLSWRSMTGNRMGGETVVVGDVKSGSRHNLEKALKADVGFLSSADGTFRKVVEPVLQQIFPEPCRYEKEFYMEFESPSAYDEPFGPAPAKRAQFRKDRIVARRVRRGGKPNMVKLASGEWIPESEVDVHVSSELAGPLSDEEE